MVSHFIISNFGNESIALIQWAYEQKLDNVTVLSVETGWSALIWQERVSLAQDYIQHLGFTSHRLKAPKSMQDLVLDRKAFPSPKFQWCAGFLKGLALNDALDDADIDGHGLVLLAKRRCSSRTNQDLLEKEEDSEHFNGRTLWHPLIEHSDSERDALIKRAGFKVLSHHALECLPCIHATAKELKVMQQDDIKRVQSLEQALATTFVHQDIETAFNLANHSSPADHDGLERFDMGCGNIWGCGS